MLVSTIIHSLLILCAAFVAILFWTNNISFLPVYKTKYILMGVMMIGLVSGMWALLSSKPESQPQTPLQQSTLFFPLISYPVPVFLTSSYLRANQLPLENSWIPIADAIFLFLLASAATYNWWKIIQNSKKCGQTHA
jgi:predicted membrane channel-forming protein YqfA (hemolysin III family)